LYIPNHFAITDSDKINLFLKQNSFGELISTVEGRTFATHLPFLFDEEAKVLRMHVAKANPQWQHLGKEELLLVVSGPHGYISPSWYHSPGVPTWNYQAVHVYGTARIITDTIELKTIVDGLTAIEEEKHPDPWQPDYAATMLKAIVGIELTVSEIQCKFKLSQNRSKVDQQAIVDGLSSANSDALAKAMASENQ
jgi:transcriptional regulator